MSTCRSGETMTDQENRGRRVAIRIAFIVLASELLGVLLMLAVGVRIGNLGLWFSLLLGLALAVGLVRGDWLARAYGSWALGLGSVGWLVAALPARAAGLIIAVCLGLTLEGCAWVLSSSPAVDAYFEGRRAKKDEVLRLERL